MATYSVNSGSWERDSNGWYLSIPCNITLVEGEEGHYYKMGLCLSESGSATLSNYDYYYSSGYRYISSYGTSTYFEIKIYVKENSSGQWYSFRGGQSYSAAVSVVQSDTGGSDAGWWLDSNSYVNITIYGKTFILPWSWTVASGSWNAENGRDYNLTYSAYQALYNKRKTTDFDYRVWNDLVDWVIHVLDALGISVTYYPSTVRCSSTDKKLWASRWNQLRKLWNAAANGLGSSRTMLAKNPGDKVTAQIFFDIVSDLNNAINNY